MEDQSSYKIDQSVRDIWFYEGKKGRIVEISEKRIIVYFEGTAKSALYFPDGSLVFDLDIRFRGRPTLEVVEEAKVQWPVPVALIATIIIALILMLTSCTKPDGVAPERSFPVDIESVMPGIYYVWRTDSAIEVVYHNPWYPDTAFVLTRWCLVEGRERATVGRGEVCVDEDTWCIELK